MLLLIPHNKRGVSLSCPVFVLAPTVRLRHQRLPSASRGVAVRMSPQLCVQRKSTPRPSIYIVFFSALTFNAKVSCDTSRAVTCATTLTPTPMSHLV